MANNIRSFYDSEIAMMEHDVIKESEIFEDGSERMMWYLAGVHDFAERIIKTIKEKGGF